MSEILHIARRADWEAARGAGEYASASGIVFCCRPSELALVARLHFAGQDDLLLVHLDPDAIPAEIEWAEYEGVEASFPHVHGPLPLAAVRRVEAFDPDADRP